MTAAARENSFTAIEVNVSAYKFSGGAREKNTAAGGPRPKFS
jgi:ribosomal protein L18E